ncbi:MAG: response regulator [Magnetococcales bacterium]|nr:response regulator [Magnetococcales bacterium]
MKPGLHGVVDWCRASCRVVVGVLMLGLGEMIALFWHVSALEEPVLSGALVAQATGRLVWGVAVILWWFHLPCFRALGRHRWMQAGIREIQNAMRGVNDVESLAAISLQTLAEHLTAVNGVFYLADDDNRLRLVAGHGVAGNPALSPILEPGAGVMGQAALQRKTIHWSHLPVECLRMDAGILEVVPRHLVVQPLLHEDQLKGVLALGATRPFQGHQLDFLEQMGGTIARAVSGVQTGAATRQLLERTRHQADELAINQTVLRGTIGQLEKESGFKSRFLANMSHELRSPLNSLLILARLLKDNKSGNLTAKQVEFAATIHAAGSDLLMLIDEILDLARIEAGRIRIFKDHVKLNDLATSLERLFAPVAREKRLEFQVALKGKMPLSINTDRHRLEQILKNLISNAIKFTSVGMVSVVFRVVQSTPESGERIAMAVADTGIGIPNDLQGEVFEPFRQLDDGANRKYGGTGLGLAISKELSLLLDGRIELVSTEGKGSVFTLYLPIEQSEWSVANQRHPVADHQELDLDGIRDDRRTLRPEDRSILVVGVDFNRIREVGERARALGLGVIVAGDQGAALFLANFFHPVAVVVAGDLPGVASIPLVERLRMAVCWQRLPALYLAPPRGEQVEGVRPEGLLIVPLSIGSAILNQECGRFLESIAAGNLRCGEKKQVAAGASPSLADSGKLADRSEFSLEGQRIVLVDDDIRNVFAMTSLLEERGGQVVMAENGRVALEVLAGEAQVDIVLLDIMMPDMNGYELLGEIRRRPGWRELPILVLTAKALQGERQRCLEAGASDYLSKPLDSRKLLSMMHIWLQRKTVTP